MYYIYFTRKCQFEDVNTDPEIQIYVTYLGSRGLHEIILIGENREKLSKIMNKGVFLRVEHEVKASSKELELSKGNSEEEWGKWEVMRDVFGAFTYRTTGRWSGSIEVQRCLPEGSAEREESRWKWESFKSYKSESGAEENYSYSGTVEEYANQYRFRYKGKQEKVTISFSYEGGLNNRVFKIVEKENENVYSAKDIEGKKGRIPDTEAWAIGSFGPHYGYPSLGIFHQERMILACTRKSPQTIWMSQPSSFENFGINIPSRDDDSITLTLASKEINEIRGLGSRGELLIFTSGGEWIARAGSKSDVFTPSSLVITPSGYRGSAKISPLEVGEVTLFVQRPGTAIRSIGYSLEVDGYQSQDITIMSSHMFEGNPVKSWAYQQSPWSLVWCVLENGEMAVLTLEREHQVNAWTRQVISGGKVKDVCAIPGEKQDELYLAVEREGLIQVERLRHREVEKVETFLDGGKYPVKAVLECMDWEGMSGNGTTQGRYKHIPVITLRLNETKNVRGIIITENTQKGMEADEVQFPLQDSPGKYEGGLFSGDVRLIPSGGVSRTNRIRLTNEDGTPIMILGIFAEVVMEAEVENEVLNWSGYERRTSIG